jgi:ABC-type lipoprotein release transport system permease subunit
MTAADPLVLGAISALMLSAALAAAWSPAHRVLRLEPQRVLRDE